MCKIIQVSNIAKWSQNKSERWTGQDVFWWFTTTLQWSINSPPLFLIIAIFLLKQLWNIIIIKNKRLFSIISIHGKIGTHIYIKVGTTCKHIVSIKVETMNTTEYTNWGPKSRSRHATVSLRGDERPDAY